MKPSKGFTLIEVVVATLITAVMMSSVFSIALSSKRSTVHADRRMVAAAATRTITSRLQEYVTADQAATIPGPGGNWVFPNSGGGYALGAGSHTLTDASPYLPGWFTSNPYNAQIIYYVQYMGSGAADTQTPWVDVTVTWTEP